uniref:Uncharacterized protein n=1 Tax=Picea glauca TaxID=3330 RepID=A0A117NI65_PICGL|nr:hypothetical protein ABT39_MTgene2716 [Picea glauca]
MQEDNTQGDLPRHLVGALWKEIYYPIRLSSRASNKPNPQTLGKESLLPTPSGSLSRASNKPTKGTTRYLLEQPPILYIYIFSFQRS